MEDAFEHMKIQGKTNLDGIIQWLKDVVSAKIIDGEKLTEARARKTFENSKDEIHLDKFKETISRFAEESNYHVNVFYSKLCGTGTVMENAYEKLKKDGKNNVDNMIQWMKDSKMIDTAKDSEEKVKKYFSEVKDQQQIKLEEFKEAVGVIAVEQTQKVSDLASKLTAAATAAASQAPRIVNALGAATSAFKDAMNK